MANSKKNPIQDAISRIRFAPSSNNLLISSWDTNLRLHDVDRSRLTFEASGEAALLDCCFQGESADFSATSDCSITGYESSIDLFDLQGQSSSFSVESSESRTCISLYTFRCQPKSKEKMDYFAAVNDIVFSPSSSGCKGVEAARETTERGRQRWRNGFLSGWSDCWRKTWTPENGYDRRVEVKKTLWKKSRTHQKNRTKPVEKEAGSDRRSGSDPGRIGNFVDFVMGDNKGYVTIWNAQSKRRVCEMPKFENSIASLSYNHGGEFLAVASSNGIKSVNICDQVVVCKKNDKNAFEITDDLTFREIMILWSV
ncbi:hypothetical protein LXL04_021124 [Taraxacum kok-saghyz]